MCLPDQLCTVAAVLRVSALHLEACKHWYQPVSQHGKLPLPTCMYVYMYVHTQLPHNSTASGLPVCELMCVFLSLGHVCSSHFQS